MEEEYIRISSSRFPSLEQQPQEPSKSPTPSKPSGRKPLQARQPARAEPVPARHREAPPPPPPPAAEDAFPFEEEQPRKPRRRSLPARLLFALLRLSVIACLGLVIGSYALTRLVPEPSTSLPPILGGGPGSTDALANLTAPDVDGTRGTHTRRSQVYNILLLGKDVSSGNTDSIIVVRFDVPNRSIGMISIPRDTAVRRTWRSNPKINGAFFGAGPDTLKEEIYDTFGIPIDFYVLVDLEGFISLVDALEGVDVDIPVDMNYDDPTPGQELHIHFQKGPTHLDGQAAMEAVRYRHDNNNSDGSPGPNQDYTDVGRASFQRQVLTQLARKVISWNSIPRVTEFIRLFRTYVKTDLSATDMLWFAGQGLQVDLDSAITQGVLEGRGDAVCKGVKWCYVFRAEDILPVLNEQVNPFREPLTEDDLDLIRADRYLF